MAALRIGLTGGIGSGKSVAAARFAHCGATVLDADATSRALTAAGGAALPAITREFGASMIDADGALDRARMRALAFTDPTARRRLESLLHPLIAEATRVAAADAEAAGAACLVFDVPLLAEGGDAPGGWRDRVHRIVVVDCAETTQVERVVRRSGWSREMVERVIAQQATRARRRAIADAVLYNEALPLDAFERQVTDLFAHWITSHVVL